MTKNHSLFKIHENLLYRVTLCADSEYVMQKRLEEGHAVIKRDNAAI